MSATHHITARDGTRLLVRTWDPAGEPRAAVLLVHGLGEHSGRYEHVGRHLAGAGFSVRAQDLRGHGGSEGHLMYVSSFGDFLTDLEPAAAELRNPGTPTVLIGHSLGGLIALRFTQEVGDAVDLLVLSAPALDADLPPWKKTMAKVLSKVAPRLTIPNDFEGGQLARDPAVGEAYFADPLVQVRTTTALGAETLSAMKAAAAGSIDLPTLVIHGSDDTLVPTISSEPLSEHPTVERVLFPGFRHESFNEDGGSEALGVVTSWIEGRLDQSSA